MTTASSMEGRARKSAVLVGLARQAIETELGCSSPSLEIPGELADWLGKPAATFVTLDLCGRLRGCIGSLRACRSLRDDLTANARAAAFEDPRFPALRVEELEALGVDVSVLSEPEPLACRDEAELLTALRPGIDGLVLEWGAHRATFLPQVWRDLPEPRDFVAALKRKADLDPAAWSAEMKLSRYTVEKYRLER